MNKLKTNPRDISWLSFNRRVLQEAETASVPVKERIKFLGIFSNNLDEFFRVRVAALRNMVLLGNKAKMHLEINPKGVLEQIQSIVLEQQDAFVKCYEDILQELKNQNIFIVNETQLDNVQKELVMNYFDDKVRTHIVPLMLESLRTFPMLNDKSLYLACKLSKKDFSIPQRYALVSVPSRYLGRFFQIPSTDGKQYIILLEDVIRLALPKIFSFFGYDQFSAHVIKVTRDAEIDIDNDVVTSFIQKLEKGLKNRKKGKPVRFVYDKDIDISLLAYLIKRLGLNHEENIVPGGRIHNFKDFMQFPNIFPPRELRPKPFIHPDLEQATSVSNIVFMKDILLNFPYHSFDSVIDMLREAAIDPSVLSIKVTCYRLASQSKIINALTNAVRNGKQVTVMIELRARFDEEANIIWKSELEEAGVKVLVGVPNFKVHAKLCIIQKRTLNGGITNYGFVSTGNLNESTAKIYGDHCLLTSNRKIMADMQRVFAFLANPKLGSNYLKSAKSLLICPTGMRQSFMNLIDNEIKYAAKKKYASVTVKVNALSDQLLIEKLTEAARAGVHVRLILRSICCMLTENSKFVYPVKAISIVDEYLEHARVIAFHNNGKSLVYISSADWMVRNLDHRIEAAAPVYNPVIKQQILDMIEIQLQDNVKARILNNKQTNEFVSNEGEKIIRSQIEIYNYLRESAKNLEIQTESTTFETVQN